MIQRHHHLEESHNQDVELKRLATTPGDSKPRFDWGTVLEENERMHPAVSVERGGNEQPFDLQEVADLVGTALTDLLLTRKEDAIFTEKNRSFVAGVAKAVSQRLLEQTNEGRSLRLTQGDLYHIVERALIENDAHDVARSLGFRRAAGRHGETGAGAMTKLIRRNGNIVDWDEMKIANAVRMAFLSLRLDPEAAAGVAQAVTEKVRRANHALAHIEDVQDMVQVELMRQGHYKVAEAYILYRAHRARLRDEQAITQRATNDERQDTMVVVRAPDGSSVFWNGEDLRKRITIASIGLDLCLNPAEIERELRRAIPAETSTRDLRHTIILNARSLIERDADFARFAGRILLTFIYEEVIGWDVLRDGVEGLGEAHRRGFKAYLKQGIEIGRLSPDLLSYDLGRLADALDPMADFEFDYLGIQTLYDRYLIVDKTKGRGNERRIETPQYFWMRVAMGLFLREEKDREGWATRLYALYKGRRFCSSTPTLFNSGTPHSQLSSCYLYKVDDSIESIMFRGIAENAFLSKWAGGLGGSWTAVRGTGGHIHGTNGESQGVIPFLKLHNDQLVAVNQGGKRRGSGCAYLESWHNDIEDFLELRRNTGDDRRRCHDMNTANWIPDLFMKRMENRQTWTLFRANETSDLHELYGRAFEERYAHYEAMAREGKIFGREVPAIDLWKKMLMMLFETGHPWITFKDACNVRSPQDHCGVIHSSNLCTEITLNTSADETAVCNLGSVVLETHIRDDGSLDQEMLGDTIRVAIRALDNVIDINFYPTEAARRANMRHRPIGLGVMGLQNALFKRGLSFASPEAVEFNDEFMEAIAYHAYAASSDLAAERGTYSSYSGSKWDRGLLPQDTLDLLELERGISLDVPRGGRLDWNPVREKIREQGMRNSNVLAIAPTATISNITATTPCIEPNFKNLYVKSNLSGDFIVLNGELVRDLKKHGLWNREMMERLKASKGELAGLEGIPEELKQKHLTVFSVDWTFIIDAAARRQKWIDQAQSVNLFVAAPDLKVLSHMYRAAWRKGLKTTYYLRSLGASDIEAATINVQKELRGVVAETAAATPPVADSTNEARVAACRLDAMMNGGECEACQ
ncbi:MAG: ribonucleoside-diphosphate reductase subunit alpha [Verrucomicrobiales bacterium]